MRNLIFVGLPGSGKSTVGRLCAKALNLPFVDADKFLEQREGRSVADIFASSGEGYFRDLESRVLAELCRRTRERLRDYGGAYCVESFHPLAVRWFRKHAPEVIRGQLAYGLGMKRAQGKKNGVLDVFLASLTGNALGRPDFVAHDEVSGNDLPTRLTRRMGAHLVAWTVRDPARMRALRKKYELQIFEGFLPDD